MKEKIVNAMLIVSEVALIVTLVCGIITKLTEHKYVEIPPRED